MGLSEWRMKMLRKWPIESLYYFTLKENLLAILESGILSKNMVVKNKIRSISFAEDSVQNRRCRKIIEVSNNIKFNLHDLVPLYLTPKTPALSARRELQKDIVFFDISLNAVCEHDVEFAFTDGNAGSAETCFYKSLYKLNKIPWEVIAAKYWTDIPGGKRKRCAEFLIYPTIKIIHFKKIIVFDKSLECFCNNVIIKKSLASIPVEINKNFYF
jgi:hypothetical protein